MELYHYTNKEHVQSITNHGLLVHLNHHDTSVINKILFQHNNAKEIAAIRNHALFFYNIEQFEEEDEREDMHLSEIMVSISDLDQTKLFVANWEHAESIIRLHKTMQKTKDDISFLQTELEQSILSYVDSFKPYSKEEDLFSYLSAEILYTKDINPRLLQIK